MKVIWVDFYAGWLRGISCPSTSSFPASFVDNVSFPQCVFLMFLSEIGGYSCVGLYVDPPPHSVPSLSVCLLSFACCSSTMLSLLQWWFQPDPGHGESAIIVPFPPESLLNYSLSDLCEVGSQSAFSLPSPVAKSVEHSLEYLLPIYSSLRTI